MRAVWVGLGCTWTELPKAFFSMILSKHITKTLIKRNRPAVIIQHQEGKKVVIEMSNVSITSI
jgi:hypothetical protein